VALAELPRIDVVLITHSHYDHLDAATVDALARQPGGPPVFVVPLGLDVWLNARGIERVVRFDWWERKRIEGLDIELTPAKHWSGRSFWNRNTTLWGGWAVLANGFSFWHAGDTAYSADFVAIGRRFGGFDLAAIPVGSYEPRWLMHDVHATPDEAARIFVDVRAQRGIGVHWGTFVLSDEPLDRPIADLAHALDLHRIPHDRFVLFRHGETRVYSR